MSELTMQVGKTVDVAVYIEYLLEFWLFDELILLNERLLQAFLALLVPLLAELFVCSFLAEG